MARTHQVPFKATLDLKFPPSCGILSRASHESNDSINIFVPPSRLKPGLQKSMSPGALKSACTPLRLHLKITPMKRRLALISLALFPVLASCEPTKEAEKPAAPTTSKAPKVRLKTSKGDIVVELNAEKAPVTVANFLGYVNKKQYDGTVFHRVIDGFMIQGGGFKLDGKNLVEKETGKGIINEGKNGLKNDRGTIAMARTSDPNSATAQFFINVVDNNMLNFPSNGGYAVFGKVVEGMAVVDKIKGVTTGSQAPLGGDVPVEPVLIQSASAE